MIYRKLVISNIGIDDAIFINKYRKPDGTEGSWDATIEDAVNGIIYYDITGSDEIDKGLYTFWAFITFNDGRSAPGESLTRFFYSEGS